MSDAIELTKVVLSPSYVLRNCQGHNRMEEEGG